MKGHREIYVWNGGGRAVNLMEGSKSEDTRGLHGPEMSVKFVDGMSSVGLEEL